MISTRPWKQSDAAFVCYLRNDPKLNRWYRQTKPLELERQKDFIVLHPEAEIIERFDEPIGVLWVKPTGEVSLVLHERDYEVIPKLFKNKPTGYYWGEVFVGNPILLYLLQAGFNIVSVKERAYYKPDVGLIDVIRVER